MFIAGFNQPGYLPESEAQEFDDRDEAMAYLVDEYERNLENDDEFSDAEIDEAVEKFKEHVSENAEVTFSYLGIDDYAYWLVEE